MTCTAGIKIHALARLGENLDAKRETTIAARRERVLPEGDAPGAADDVFCELGSVALHAHFLARRPKLPFELPDAVYGFGDGSWLRRGRCVNRRIVLSLPPRATGGPGFLARPLPAGAVRMRRAATQPGDGATRLNVQRREAAVFGLHVVKKW